MHIIMAKNKPYAKHVQTQVNTTAVLLHLVTYPYSIQIWRVLNYHITKCFESKLPIQYTNSARVANCMKGLSMGLCVGEGSCLKCRTPPLQGLCFSGPYGTNHMWETLVSTFLGKASMDSKFLSLTQTTSNILCFVTISCGLQVNLSTDSQGNLYRVTYRLQNYKDRAILTQ